MENIILSGDDYQNGKLLFEKGPRSTQTLVAPGYQDLINQGLAEVDENDIIALTETGLNHFKAEQEAEEKARQLDKDETEDETKPKEEKKESEEATEEESEETEETENPVATESFYLGKKEITYQRNIANMDALNVSTEGISEILKKTMPGIVNGFAAFVNAIRPNDPALSFNFNRKDFIPKLENTNFVNLSQLPVAVPQGLGVKYMVYINSIETSVERCERVHALIDEFTAYTSQVITNSDMQKSSVSKEAFYTELQSSREAAYATVGACFNKGNNTKLPYGKLVDRNKDWDTVINAAQDLCNRMNKIDRPGLIKKAKHLQSLLTKVKESSNRGGFDMASPETVKCLAEGSFQIASELEFYAVTYYRITVLTECINQAVEIIEKAANLSSDKK